MWCFDGDQGFSALGYVVVHVEPDQRESSQLGVVRQDPEIDVGQRRHGGDAIELGRQDVGGAGSERERLLGQHELEALVLVEEDLLTLKAGCGGTGDVGIAEQIDQRKDPPRVLGCLKQSWYESWLEDPNGARPGLERCDIDLYGRQAFGDEARAVRVDFVQCRFCKLDKSGANLVRCLGGGGPPLDL